MRDLEKGGLTCCVVSQTTSWEVDEGHCDGQLVMQDSEEWVNDILLDLRLRVDDARVELFCDRV